MKYTEKRDRGTKHAQTKKQTVPVCHSDREKGRKGWRNEEVRRAVLSIPSTLTVFRSSISVNGSPIHKTFGRTEGERGGVGGGE